MWYLTAKMVPLALFSAKVPDAERRRLADRLLANKPDADIVTPTTRFGTGLGKPKFPNDLSATTTLADVVTPDPWFAFSLRQLQSDFLLDEVTSQSDNPSFQASNNNLKAINDVSDSAESGIKLSSDFLASSKVE
jgi:hypothetical protein